MAEETTTPQEPAETREKVEGEVPASEEEVEAPQTRKRERKPRKKRFSPQIWKFYQVNDQGVSKLRKECPRCGSGVFLAEHSNRKACGRCGYAEFTTK